MTSHSIAGQIPLIFNLILRVISSYPLRKLYYVEKLERSSRNIKQAAKMKSFSIPYSIVLVYLFVLYKQLAFPEYDEYKIISFVVGSRMSSLREYPMLVVVFGGVVFGGVVFAGISQLQKLRRGQGLCSLASEVDRQGHINWN